jgi:hypothetical protein
LLKDPDVAETKLTGVLDMVWAVALAAVTAWPWSSPAGTDPPQLQTMAAAAAKQTMNRIMVPSWSPTMAESVAATDASRRWNQSDHLFG